MIRKHRLGGWLLWAGLLGGACNNSREEIEVVRRYIDSCHPSVRSLAVGDDHACAVLEDQTVRCWGANETGQLGDGTKKASTVARPVKNIDFASTVVVGAHHSCIRGRNEAWCWGSNAVGQLGSGSSGGSSVTPVLVPIGGINSQPASIAAGGDLTCIGNLDLFARCWGDGTGLDVGSLEPLALSAMPNSGPPTCVRWLDGGVRCWGSNEEGQLGNDSAADFVTDQPVAVSSVGGARWLATSPTRNCAIVSAGDVRCWGDATSGGNGFGTQSVLAVSATTGEILEVSNGSGMTCILRRTGVVDCLRGMATPLETVSLSGPATHIALGGTTACAALADGGIECWPRGDTTLSGAPVAIPFCAVASDGGVPDTDASSDAGPPPEEDALAALLGVGEACTSDGECANGICVDGVCCQDECGDGVDDCQACSQNAGGTANGSCTAVVDERTCGTSGACRVAATCSPTSKVCPDDTAVPAGTLCDAPSSFCEWVQPTCNQATLSCPAHDLWAADACKSMNSSPLPTDLGGGQSTPGGATVTPDGSSDAGTPSIGFRKLSQEPTCPSSTPAHFSLGSPAQYWQIETSPPGAPLPATVCINYLPTTLSITQQCNLQLYHGDATTCDWGPSMGNVCPSNGYFCGSTTSRCATSDTNGNPIRSAGTICGHVDHFSPFGLFAPELADIPTVTVPAPMVVGATTAAGAVVTFAASAHDAHDGDLAAQCTPASGSTFPLGMTTVVCSAANSLGFRGGASFTVWVQVQAPTDGTFFLPPINPDGSSIFKRGSTIPVKFKLTGASAGIGDLVAHLTVAKVSNTVTGSYVEAASPGAANTGDTFRYDCVAHQYIFNLSTKGLSVGTWSLRADLGDGVNHTINVSLR